MHSGTRQIILGILAVLASAVLVLEILRPYLYLAPDSFTYFTMARHVWDAHLLYSYSGVDHTTGIHPGYYFLLIPLYPIFEVLLPYGSLVLGMLLVIAGTYVLYRSAGTLVSATLLLLALTPFGVSMTNNGMESSLLFFALCLLAALLSKPRVAKEEPFLIGCCMAFALFARLDTIFLAATFSAVLVFQFFRERGVKKENFFDGMRMLVLFSIPIAAVLVLVFFLDFRYGGALLPVSGSIKSSFPSVSPEWLQHLLSLKTFALSLLVSGCYLLFRFWKHQPIGILMPALFLATLLLYLYNGLFVSDIGIWYGALPFFTLSFALGSLAAEAATVVPERLKMLTPLVCGVVACLIIASHLFLSDSDWITPHRTAAAFLDSHAKAGEAAGELKDGVFAFYSSLHVYNLTGLGNNAAYIEAQRAGSVDEYLMRRNIRYVVGGTFGSGVQIPGSRVDFRLCSSPFYDTGLVKIYDASSCILRS